MDLVRKEDIYVGGSFEPATTDTRSRVINPANGAVIAEVPAAGIVDVDRVVAAARTAFDSGPWPQLSGAERADVLERFAAALVERTPELAATVTMEAGFPTAFVGDVHIRNAIAFVRYYATLARSEPFEEVRGSAVAHADVRVRRCPVGVVAALVPWNIPLLGALSKIAPALAAGCTVVYKPSPETPLIAYLVAEAAQKAAFPPGVFNMVTASLKGSERLTAHPDVDMVGFTGSTDVGRRIAQACAADFRRHALELGGNAAAIVLDDAPADLIAGVATTGLAINSGQACIAQRRVLAPRGRYNEIVEILASVAKSLPVGNPSDPTTVIGPMITAEHRDQVLNHIDSARAAGAVVAAGGRSVGEKGFFVEPTVLANVTNDMDAARKEVFGPVVCVIAYDTIEDAIAIARDTEYGLSSSVWSSELGNAESIGRKLRVGSVYINQTLTLDPAVPFGGFGHSGVGRELGPEGLDAYCEIQSIFVPRAL
ncbi:aldehyde dehydrogenase family protein [Gordonia sp. HY285]|uniref:aldehyde dehydrogenase family protein n=1 Tax=Gordonia liuliyuniae TaxID=2911517 RepID=UPI001F1CB038|nr:aldehyde dehydrogenase family protein [Gordonia liuliyuniae]MCF8608934.1 aldehyde dehydrogenase family protein [Gordonia liuliyuniae]